MNRRTLLWMAAMMALAIGPTAYADETKIGHVDLMRVFETYRQSDPASIRFQEEVDRKKKEFDIKRDAVVFMRDSVEKLEPRLSADEMDEKKRAVDAESTALMTLINETQRGLKAKGEFLQSAASKIVRAAIEEVANEGGYHYVLDGGQRPILFSAESLDITDEVLKKIMKDQ